LAPSRPTSSIACCPRVDRLERELDVKPAENLFEGTRTLRVYNLLARGDVFAEVPVHDHVLPIVERVLDRGCLVSSLSSIDILPGELAQPLHADDMLIPLPRPHVPIVCNSMWALSDFTEVNGATRLVPGSHARGPRARARREHRHDRGGDATRQRPRLQRQPVAREAARTARASGASGSP
jgi:hypothetical protein